MLDLTLSSPTLDRLRARFAQAPAVVERAITRGLDACARETLAEVRRLTPVRSGTLRDGWEIDTRGGGAGRQAVVVNAVPYARHVEEGTRPHVIRPRQASVLRFEVEGRVVFARRVRHPGTRGARMLERAAANTRGRSVRIMAGHLGFVTRYLAGR